MPIMQVSGFSDTGKTRLVEALCGRLPGPVLVVKFSHHGGAPDRTGSDSERFAAAGAETLLMQPGQATWRGRHPLPIDWVQALSWYPWIIWEGAKHSPTPKIVLDLGPLVSILPSVRAVIGPSPPPISGILWFEAALPLSVEAAREAACWIEQHQASLTFSAAQIPAATMPTASE